MTQVSEMLPDLEMMLPRIWCMTQIHDVNMFDNSKFQINYKGQIILCVFTIYVRKHISMHFYNISGHLNVSSKSLFPPRLLAYIEVRNLYTLIHLAYIFPKENNLRFYWSITWCLFEEASCWCSCHSLVKKCFIILTHSLTIKTF